MRTLKGNVTLVNNQYWILMWIWICQQNVTFSFVCNCTFRCLVQNKNDSHLALVDKLVNYLKPATFEKQLTTFQTLYLVHMNGAQYLVKNLIFCEDDTIFYKCLHNSCSGVQPLPPIINRRDGSHKLSISPLVMLHAAGPVCYKISSNTNQERLESDCILYFL